MKSHGKRQIILPHPNQHALLLYRDDLMVSVVLLSAFHTNRCLFLLAKHIQELVVTYAEVTGDEGGRICQPVLCQHCISKMGCQVSFTVRFLADETRLNRRYNGSLADVTGNIRHRRLSWHTSLCWGWLVWWLALYRS